MTDSADSNDPPAAGSRRRGPTPEQVQLLASCIIEGRSRSEKARALGKSVRTVDRWSLRSEVGEELKRRRSATHLTRAVGVLNELQLHCPDDKIRLQAAQTLLKFAGREVIVD